MSLRKVGNVWIFRCKVNGQTWSRSTEETDKRKAFAKIPKLEALAQLHRDQPVKSVKFSRAMVAEVARVEVDVSSQSALRVHFCLKSFLKWLGQDIELSKIDTDLLERFQRDRLREVSVNTVDREIYAIVAMLRQNKFRVEKPKSKPGKKTEQRDFTEEELGMFFRACDEDQKTLFSFLLATGARPAEVIPSVRSKHVALLKKELDPQACMVTIRTAKLKPNQKPTPPRIIKISKELMDRVMAHAQTTEGPHVFSVNQSLCHLFDRICIRAGLATVRKVNRKDKKGKQDFIHKTDELGKKITAHSFRHTYASIMARRVSYNPNALKEIMGHRQLKSTDRYVHAHSNGEVVEVSGFLTPASEGAVDKLGVRAGGKKKAAVAAAAS